MAAVMQERGWGAGSVYRRGDGKWVGAAEVPRAAGEPRRRRSFVGRDREDVERRLAAWVAENRKRIAAPSYGPRGRQVHMERARGLGSHTAQEWREKVATYGGLCHYCQRPRMLVTHKDHVIPITRGGSDGLDNVVPTCADCNEEKSTMTGVEFEEWAARSGFFRRKRKAQLVWNGRVVRMPADAVRALRRSRRGVPRRLGGLL